MPGLSVLWLLSHILASDSGSGHTMVHRIFGMVNCRKVLIGKLSFGLLNDLDALEARIRVNSTVGTYRNLIALVDELVVALCIHL